MSISWRDNRNNTARGVRRLARNALFLCVALMLSYLESFLPILPLPGFKLGFANVVVMLVFFYHSPTDAAIVSLARVCLLSLLFGNPVSFAFSVSGAVLSFLGLVTVRYMARGVFSFVGVSALCAALHNLGQILAASLLFDASAMISYLPVLLLASIVFGGITGVFVNYFAPKLTKLKG